MRKFVKGLAIAAIILVVLAVIGISVTIGWHPFIGPRSRPLTSRKFESTLERLKRGAYLVEHVSGCAFCHTPFQETAAGPEIVASKKASGQVFPLPGFPGTVVAPNLTPDPETGIGNWTDDQLARAIREGIGHDGRTLFPLMPYTYFRHMTDEDLASVVVYLRSLPPIRNPLPATEIHFPIKYLIRTAPEPVTEAVQADVSTPVSRGKYLVGIALCADCHTPSRRGQLVAGMDFAGGQVFDLGSKKIASPNITPDSTGIGSYTEDTFVKTLRTGYVGTRQLNTFMPWQGYSALTDNDLKDMYAYLKTLTPVSHRVDNSKSATPCRKCGAVHGGGDTN
jgi:mono/diheme cytochrome c family protein